MPKKTPPYLEAADALVAAFLHYKGGNVKRAEEMLSSLFDQPGMDKLVAALDGMNERAYAAVAAGGQESEDEATGDDLGSADGDDTDFADVNDLDDEEDDADVEEASARSKLNRSRERHRSRQERYGNRTTASLVDSICRQLGDG